MLVTYPMMAAIQEISGRIGRVTGHGLAGNVCRNYPAPIIWSLITLLFVANTINVAADLGAMSDAAKLLIGGPAPLYVVLFGVISVIAQIFFKYERYVAILKWLTLVLFAYVVALFVVKVPWSEASPLWWRSWERRSRPIYLSGNFRRKPRISASILKKSR